MAGLPKPVIDRANQILDTYMKKSLVKHKTKNEKKHNTNESDELMASLIKKIDQIDINNITPYKALEILAKLKGRNDF